MSNRKNNVCEPGYENDLSLNSSLSSKSSIDNKAYTKKCSGSDKVVYHDFKKAQKCIYITGSSAVSEVFPDDMDKFYFTQVDNSYILNQYKGNSQSIVIPDTVNGKPVKMIGENVFSNCANLRSVVISDGVVMIGSNSFRNCENLESITLPRSLKTIGDNTFKNCGSIKSIVVPESVTSIGDGAFNGCIGLVSIDMADSMESIGSNAFDGCISLKNVKMPDGITTISQAVFARCINLEAISLPNASSIIGAYAFLGCTGLKSITVPEGVNAVGRSAFQGCSSLCEITFEGTVNQIDSSAFSGISSQNIIFSVPSGEKDVYERLLTADVAGSNKFITESRSVLKTAGEYKSFKSQEWSPYFG